MLTVIGWIGILIAVSVWVLYLYRPSAVGMKLELVSAEMRGDQWVVVFETNDGFEEVEAPTLQMAFEKAYKSKVGL